MLVRVLLDKYEIAMLFRAYEKISDGDSVNVVAASLSKSLRNLAIRRGLSVDATFRNVNGMRLKLANVQYLFTNGAKGLYGASSLMREMFQLYKQNQAEFQEILRKAIQMTGEEMSVEDAFFAYAKDKTSLSPRMLAYCLKKATDYCNLKQPLLGMTDVVTIECALNKIAGDRLLRFQSWKNTQTIRNVLELYYNFIMGYHNNPHQSITEKTVSCTSLSDDENVKFVNFSQDSSYKFTKPISYIYRGERHDVTSWKELYVEVCGLLFADYHQPFMSIIMNGDIPGHSALAFADELNSRRMCTPKCFTPGYYLESRLSATYILRKLCGLHKLLNLGDTIQIAYMKTNDYQPYSASGHSETEKDEYPIADNNSVPKPQDQNLLEAVESAVLSTSLSGITVEELAAKLGVTALSIKNTAQTSLNLVEISGRLIHKYAFVDWEDGANRLEAIIDKLMLKNNGYISYTQFYEYAHTEMQMFLNDNNMDDPRKVFDMAEYLFAKEGYHNKHYTFWMKTHISRAEEIITSKLDIIRKYARDNGGFFREEELEDYLKSLSIKTASLRQQMKVYDAPIFLFYAPGIFITSESMYIDEDWLTKTRIALEKLFDDTGDHVVLRDIQPWWYALLPKLPNGRSWTALLLQSVLFHYGQQVGAKTIRALTNQSFDTLNAMVVSIDSEIRTFADAVISVLLDDNICQREFSAEELRLLLVKRGLIAGNELMRNMPNAIPSDERFVWTMDGQRVTINL